MLTSQQKRQLRARAHGLQVIVTTGQRGVTPAVIAEIDQALEHHALVKVRLNAPDRAARQAMIQEICAATRSDHVQTIGHVLILYREPETPET